jgi:hypothetical protein
MKLFTNKLTKRATNILLALFLAAWQLALPVLYTQSASATNNPPNPNDVPYWCSNYDGGVKFNTGAVGTHAQNVSGGSVSITIVDPNKTEVSNVTGTGVSITKAVIKGGSSGGNGGNGNQVYAPPFSYNLKAPNNSGGQQADISHVIVCYDDKTTVEVIKKLAPQNDPGKFELYVNDNKKADNVGHNGTTGQVEISSFSNLTVKETAESGTALSNYNTNIECRNQDGTLLGSGTTNGATVRQMTLPSNKIDSGDDIVCVFTNSRKTGNLKVIKDVVNNNGGTKTYADFTFKTSASDTARSFDATTSPDGEKVVSLPAGSSYSVAEVEANTGGYATTYSAGCSGTVVEGQQQVCTITNDDIAPKLTVTKVVKNDNGGTKQVSDFPLFVNGNLVLSGVQNVFNAGQAAATETNQSGYTASFSGDCDLSGLLNMAIGGVYTCTITNSDQPGKLIVKKVLVKDNGGTEEKEDFSFSVNGDPSVNFEADGENEYSVPAGTYSVVEDVYDSYATTYDNCADVVIANGETATCTITNNDKPPVIRVHKYVTYGSDTNQAFDFEIDNDGNSSQYSVSDGGTITRGNLQAGHVTVSETVPAGWDQVYMDCYDDDWSDWSNGSTVEIGREYRCYVLNDQLGELTVVKDTQPNDKQDFHFTIERLEEEECEAARLSILIDNLCGDSQLVPYDEFDLDDDSDATLSDHKTQYAQGGYYVITETQVSGWDLDDIDCGNNRIVSQTANSVTVYIAPGQSVACTFVNKKNFVPQVLGEVTPTPKVLAVTGVGYDWRGSAIAFTLSGAALATVFARRKESHKK